MLTSYDDLNNSQTHDTLGCVVVRSRMYIKNVARNIQNLRSQLFLGRFGYKKVGGSGALRKNYVVEDKIASVTIMQ
jgi:hypothetical protein